MDNVHYGRLIANARVEKGLTQTELAERLGVTQTSVSEMEGRENVGSVMLERCARVLGVSFVVG